MYFHLRPALTLLGALSLLLGLAYPLAMTGLAQALFPQQANGSLIERNGTIIGSALIGQPFSQARYLHGRPSATAPAYNAQGSTGSNLGPSRQALLEAVTRRAAAFDLHPAPSEMATASASGLDPHISQQAALAQVPRIAAARKIPSAQVEAAIRNATSGPAFGFVGTPVVNVLKVNLALDGLEG